MQSHLVFDTERPNRVWVQRGRRWACLRAGCVNASQTTSAGNTCGGPRSVVTATTRVPSAAAAVRRHYAGAQSLHDLRIMSSAGKRLPDKLAHTGWKTMGDSARPLPTNNEEVAQTAPCSTSPKATERHIQDVAQRREMRGRKRGQKRSSQWARH